MRKILLCPHTITIFASSIGKNQISDKVEKIFRTTSLGSGLKV